MSSIIGYVEHEVPVEPDLSRLFNIWIQNRVRGVGKGEEESDMRRVEDQACISELGELGEL